MDTHLQEKSNTPDEASIRSSLKRCSEQTVLAALSFQKKQDPELVPIIALGIIERFLEPEIRPRLQENNDNLRLVEDLGVDSLTMVEIVILTEEVLSLKIENEELTDLRTIADLKTFIDCKVKGIPPPAKPKNISAEEMDSIMPYGRSFYFLQEASLRPTEITGRYQISGQEFFLESHFENNPIFPASIMLEALGQLAVLYLLTAQTDQLEAPVDASKILFSSCDGVRTQKVCKPGDTLELRIRPKRIKHPMASFEGTITSSGQKVTFAEEITLFFDYKASN